MQDQQANIQHLYDNQGLLDILIAIEKYFEDNDLYAYPNIQSGEVVEGPEVEKYWITIVLKYYRENFPDPYAFKILEQHGTKVQAKGDYEIRPIEHPRSKRDMQNVTAQHGSISTPRDERVPVLLVRIQIPRSIINPESFDEYKLNIAELNKVQEPQEQEEQTAPAEAEPVEQPDDGSEDDILGTGGL